MFYIIGYYLLSGGIFYFILQLIIKRTDKINSKKLPKISGYANLLIVSIFLALYYFNPGAFSPDVTIDNKILYILMAIFSGYFYMIAPGISTSNLAVLYKQKYKNAITKKQFYLVSMVNLTAIFFFGLLTYQLFG